MASILVAAHFGAAIGILRLFRIANQRHDQKKLVRIFIGPTFNIWKEFFGPSIAIFFAFILVYYFVVTARAYNWPPNPPIVPPNAPIVQLPRFKRYIARGIQTDNKSVSTIMGYIWLDFVATFQFGKFRIYIYRHTQTETYMYLLI